MEITNHAVITGQANGRQIRQPVHRRELIKGSLFNCFVIWQLFWLNQRLITTGEFFGICLRFSRHSIGENQLQASEMGINTGAEEEDEDKDEFMDEFSDSDGYDSEDIQKDDY